MSGEQWSVVRKGNQYFARFDFNGSLVGPYGSEAQAREFFTRLTSLSAPVEKD